MKIEFMWKDENSNISGCPSLSRVTGGPDGYFVVGKQAPAEARAQIPHVSEDDIIVFVPDNVLDRLKGLDL